MPQALGLVRAGVGPTGAQGKVPLPELLEKRKGKEIKGVEKRKGEKRETCKERERGKGKK